MPRDARADVLFGQHSLQVTSYLDTNVYPTGVTPTDAEMATVHIERADFHDEWNYTILPHPKS
jgi:hypothetical protein